MSNFKIEDQIINSVGYTQEGNPVFTVVSWQGRNFLYVGDFVEQDWQGESRIAECVSGDYAKRFGGIKGWLKHILKRTNKRLDKIEDQLYALQTEQSELYNLKQSIQEVGVR